MGNQLNNHFFLPKNGKKPILKQREREKRYKSARLFGNGYHVKILSTNVYTKEVPLQSEHKLILMKRIVEFKIFCRYFDSEQNMVVCERRTGQIENNFVLPKSLLGS